jgi:glycosyltransferase involved in cell wall biosynthesis
MTFRLAALTSHPIQYQVPLFRELAEREEIDLTVYFCDTQGFDESFDPGFGKNIEWDIPLVDGYDYVFLDRSNPLKVQNDFFVLNPEIRHHLVYEDFDAIWVHGYGALTNLFTFAVAHHVNLPIILRGEGTLPTNPGVVDRTKQAFFGQLFDYITAFAYIGTRNREFYENHGVPEEQLFHAPYTVNNEFFQERAQSLPPTDELRSELKIPQNRPVVLFVGKLIKRKRPALLIDAFVKATDPGEAALLMVGDGMLSDQLKRRVSGHDRKDDIHFAGFVNQTELPRYYGASDLFVLPSSKENWGLVVNEAMNFGLPIVTTEAVGCADDLVTMDNGRVVPTDNVNGLSSTLRELLKNEQECKEMGEHSLNLIDHWGIKETADGILTATRYSVTTD